MRVTKTGLVTESDRQWQATAIASQVVMTSIDVNGKCNGKTRCDYERRAADRDFAIVREGLHDREVHKNEEGHIPIFSIILSLLWTFFGFNYLS